jgi:predicted phage terminase large subunit-like protein
VATTPPLVPDLSHVPRDVLRERLAEEISTRQAREDSERLSGSLKEFIRAAFPVIKPERPFLDNWHLDAKCAHLEAITDGEIRRLQIWEPPGMMKSLTVHVFWPVWEWTRRPGLRYWCASHSLDLVWMHCDDSRTLLSSEWFQARWGHLFEMTWAGQKGYGNNRGGTRVTTAPKSGGVGKHGDRIIIDDLLDASDAEATTRAVLKFTNEWYDATIAGRKETDAAEVLIMQRLHEDDIAAHALEVGDWEVLCIPERFEPKHPFAWRGKRVHRAVKQRLRGSGLEKGDPRKEDQVLWPSRRDEAASTEYARRLGSFRAAGQLQQRPAAREGLMLKRDWWRFYNPAIRSTNDWSKLPTFGQVVISVDTPLKDKESSDNVAIQCWGVRAADRYLLDLRLGKMNYNLAKRQVREMAQWARQIWRCPQYVLIENAGYGVELIIDLKREITGVTKISPGAEGNKVSRAASASDALESGNCFLPGYGPPWQPAYDEHRTPEDITKFIHNCALFPNAAHDDDVDAWSQTMNWLRSRASAPMRTSSALLG